MVEKLNQHGVPITVACRRLGISRSTYYYQSKREDEHLKEAIIEIAYRYPSFGYRRITAVLRRQGFEVNHKKVYRLYRELNLQKSVKRRGYKKKATYGQPPAAEHPNHVWSIDIIEDRTEDSRKIRILNVIDVYSRYVFTPLVDSSITGEKAARYFEELILQYGTPKVIVRDDGSEFRSGEFGKVVRKYRIEEIVIPPGEPFRNGYVESFHSRFREELLSAEVFKSIEDARSKIAKWIEWYNFERPHSSLNYLSPSEVFYAEKESLYF